MGLSPAALLVDSDGNPIEVIDDIDEPGKKRLLVESDIKPGARVEISPTIAEPVIGRLVNGSSPDMVVDGSVTPVSFVYAAGADTTQLSKVRIALSVSAINLDGDSFGKGSPLTNGIEVKLVANNGDINKTLITLKLNEDLFLMEDLVISQAGVTDAMAGSLGFGGSATLVGGSSDKLEVVINDNLTAVLIGLNYLQATVYGYVE